MRQEVKDTKVEDDSFYLLTLATVAKELKRRGLEEAKVFLAVGLPLTRFGAEKNDFIKYLTKNKRVSFKYENESFHIEIDDVAVFSSVLCSSSGQDSYNGKENADSRYR